ncbi:unnamed protein product [Echinostoma caproni]|uniref:Menin n=1 Tax=Echinostoma caproni TaxID=27848 RepID=A0A183AHC5_9TREM|nr:unnamed protein product [Echinostoma caproni]
MDNLKLLPNTTQSPKLISTVDRIPEPVEPVSMALTLYYRAVEVDRCFYANQHVYPYTCLASCLYRHGDNRGALRYWSEAARVMGHYNHSSEDWEIYRELLEVATQLMPHMFRYAAEASRSCSEGAVDTDPDGCLYQPENILDDPQCLAYLLAFYDNLCLWEEGSPVPVLHVGWVDKLMVNLTRFSQRARRLLRLSADLSRFDGHTPECVPEISEPISCPEIGPPSKRVRRHSRSVVVGRDELHHHHHQQPVQSSTGATLPIPTDSLDLKNVLKFSCPVSTKQKPENLENLDTAVDGTASPAAQSLSKSGSRTPLSAITPLVESLTVNPNASIAFLWGLERDVPFLPANVAPEEAFTKLLSALEPDSSSLFPTPPNSGGLYEPVTDKLTEDNIARPNLIGKSLSDVEEFPNADFVLSTECAEGQASEHSSDIPLFPDCLDSMEGTENMVTLDELSDEFLQSVNDLVQSARSTGFASSDACEPSSPVLESAVSEQCSASVESRIRPKRPRTMEELMVDLVLSSIKMVSIIELLRAPRLNSSAIKLALTAQSQVCLRRTGLCPANGV